MKKILTVVTLILLSANLFSQNYKTAVGLRTGTVVGGSIKHFINQPGAVEGIFEVDIVKLDELKVKAAGLYEHHFDLNVDGLYAFAGGGLSVGVHVAGQFSKQVLMGFEMIGGVEYKFSNIPLALTADWNPRIQIISNSGIKLPNFGFTIRYIIK